MIRKALTLILAMAALSATFAFAAEEGADAPLATRVRVIRASNEGKPFVDPRLRDILEQLTKIMRFKRYVLASSASAKIAVDTKSRFALPGDLYCEVKALKRDARKGTVSFEFTMLRKAKEKDEKDSTVFRTRRTVKSGASFLAVCPGSGDDRHLVAVTVK